MQSRSDSSDQHGYRARNDQPAVNYTDSELATTYAGSMSGAGGHQRKVDDDGQSKVSVYTSYTEVRSVDELVRKEGNRTFNKLSESYSMPTDLNEWERLDKQHRAITLGLGGLYPAPEVVRAILAPEGGVTKRIVDLGCGTGIWTTEMAREFPHCEVLGVDLAPVPILPENVPQNCRFEMDDINLGLSHLHEQFDVVFARLIALGLKNIRKTLADMEACAKPGGIVIWLDADLDIYSGYPPVYRPFWSSHNPHGSYLVRTTYEARRISVSLLGSDVRTMEKILDEGFWTHATNLDPDTCKTASLYLPIGTWCNMGDNQEERDRVKYVGMLMRYDVADLSETLQPLFLKAGWSKEVTDRWGDKTREEAYTGTMGFRIKIAWGRRRVGPDLPAPPLPKVQLEYEESQPISKYPLYEIFDTPQQALAAMETRIQNKDIPDAPLPSSGME